MGFSAEELRNILRESFNDAAHEFYGIYDFEQALREPNVNVVDALLTFIVQKIERSDLFQWRIVDRLTNVLISQSHQQELTEEQAERFLSLIEKGQNIFYDDDKLYQVINCLDTQKYTAVLMKFVEKLVREKQRQDWCWIAYAVIGRSLGNRFQFPRELVGELVIEALKEKDPHRRNQMIFLSGRLAENQKLYT